MNNEDLYFKNAAKLKNKIAKDAITFFGNNGSIDPWIQAIYARIYGLI